MQTTCIKVLSPPASRWPELARRIHYCKKRKKRARWLRVSGRWVKDAARCFCRSEDALRDREKINSPIVAQEFWPLARRERRAYPVSGSVRSEQRSQRAKGQARIGEVIFSRSLSCISPSVATAESQFVFASFGVFGGPTPEP